MASSSTEIANMALSHLGVGKEIASLTEASSEARACNRFYEQARNEVLRDGQWTWARKQVTLGLVEEEPTDEWAYSYTYPTDCERFLRIQIGTRNAPLDGEPKFQIVRGTAGTVIYTDEESAIGEYIVRETDVARYPSDFVAALSLKLAMLIAPRIVTVASAFQVQQALEQRYLIQVQQAAANGYNEERVDEPPESQFVRDRE